MSKAKRTDSSTPTQFAITNKLWSAGFELAGDLARETSAQLEALVAFLAGLGASGTRLVSKSNKRISTLVLEALEAAEKGGPELTAAARGKIEQLVSDTQSSAKDAAHRATESAKALIAPAAKTPAKKAA